MSSVQSLRELLAGSSEINICHNNPDPDCLASALALGRIAAAAGIDERRILYSGDISHVGRTAERDSLPQAADYLATLEGVETAIVFGIVDEGIQLSARSTDSRVHIGDALATAFEDVGSAGGHQEMAGGEIPLGIFAEYTTDDGQLFEIVESVVTARIVAGLNLTRDD